jgi:uncharacterized protein YciI
MYVLELLPPYKDRSNWTEQTNKTLGAHWNYLVEQNSKGIIKMVARTDYSIDNEDNRGIAVFEAESIEKAREIMANDPCIKNAVMTAKVHPLLLFMYGGKVLER